MNGHWRSLLVMSFFAPLFAAAPARAQDTGLAGRNINLYIGFGAGGSYDFFGRVAARHLGKHIKGVANVVPQNMPGAGSFYAANFVYKAAPKDGTALGLFTQNLALQELLGAPGVQFRTRDFNWVGRITTTVEVHVAARKVKTIEDAKRDTVILSGSGSGSPSETYPLLMNALAGTKFKIISGYPGSAQGVLAMERGEVDGVLSSWNSIKRAKPQELKDGTYNVIVQHGLKRHPDLPNVPALVELASTEEGKSILELNAGAVEVGFAIAAPPGTQPGALASLREAFGRMLGDSEFINEFKRSQSDLEPASAQHLESIIEKMYAAPPKVIAETKRILGL